MAPIPGFYFLIPLDVVVNLTFYGLFFFLHPEVVFHSSLGKTGYEPL